MYFTRCNVSKRKALGCEIFTAKRQGDKWGKVESLGLADDSVVIAHPAISPDELTLYFVSDMDGSTKTPEGKNSKDIWMVTRSRQSKWSDPVNLGTPVNTPGDEIFPLSFMPTAPCIFPPTDISVWVVWIFTKP